MNEEVFNLDTRKFLKHFGVTAQREIERAVREAVDQGRLAADGMIRVRARLEIEPLGENHVIDGEIRLQ
jgi:hypothetical protein